MSHWQIVRCAIKKLTVLGSFTRFFSLIILFTERKCIFHQKMPLFACHPLTFEGIFHSHRLSNAKKRDKKHKLSSDIFVHCQLPDTRTARWNVWPIKCFSWTHFTIPILLFYLYFIFIVVDFVPCHFFFALFFPFVLRFFVCVCACSCSRSHTRVYALAIPFYLLTHYMRSFSIYRYEKYKLTHTDTATATTDTVVEESQIHVLLVHINIIKIFIICDYNCSCVSV